MIEKMFEKARTADLATINSIVDKVFPQVSTSFTLQEILMYASAYSDYTLGENMGFPIDKTTDTLSGLGSIVIPQDLTSNVTKLHEFLFGTAGYTPSSTVQTVNGNIISTVNSAQSSYEEEYYEDDTDYYDEADYYDDTDYSEDQYYEDEYYEDDYYEEDYGDSDSGDSGSGDYDTGWDDGSGSEDWDSGDDTWSDSGDGSGTDAGEDSSGETDDSSYYGETTE